MDSGNLVTEFYIKKYEKKTTYSAGYDIFFARPCVAYVKKGYAKFFYKGKTIYAHEGDLVYIAPETQYQSIWYGEPDVEWYSVSFDFNSPYAFRDFRFQVLKNYSGELFEKMYEHYENSPFLSVSYFYCILDDIYNYEICRNFVLKKANVCLMRRNKKTIYSLFAACEFDKLVIYIRRHIKLMRFLSKIKRSLLTLIGKGSY